MTRSRPLVWLSGLIAALALVATAIGLFGPGGGSPFDFTPLRGDPVQMYGRGLYGYDTLFTGAGNIGTDLTTLVLGLPLLVGAMVAYQRGSRRGQLVLLGALAYFLYVYTLRAVGTAYNALFLLNVALFSASFFAFVRALTLVEPQSLPADLLDRLPRRALGGFMIAAGLLTSVVWLGPLVGALAAGEVPPLLDSYTTMVTDAIDLAIIVPSTLISGTLILRGRRLGVVLAVPLLFLLAMLLPMIALQTVFQLRAGVAFTTAEIVGPMGGFLVFGAGAVWAIVKVLRAVEAGSAPASNAQSIGGGPRNGPRDDVRHGPDRPTRGK